MSWKRVGIAAVAIVAVLIAAWLGASFYAGSKTVAATSPGQKWEYMVVGLLDTSVWNNDEAHSGKLTKALGTTFSAESPKAECALDGAGRAGWELVTVTVMLGGGQGFFFKRPLP